MADNENSIKPADDKDEIGPLIGLMLILLMFSMISGFGLVTTPKKASLSGHVRNIDGEPVEGAHISLNGHAYNTGIDGHYVFSDLDIGQYILSVANAQELGYEPKSPMTVNLVEGLNTQDIILTPPISPTLSSLSGVVKNSATGIPINAADVTLNGHSTTTSSFGIYSFTNIDPGNYVLTVEKDGFHGVGMSIMLSVGDNTQDILLEEIPEPNFEVTNLIISPSEVYVGDTVNISATVTNTGDAQGTYTVNCSVTPDTFTPAEIVPVVPEIPWSSLLTVVVLAMVMKVITRVVKE